LNAVVGVPAFRSERGGRERRFNPSTLELEARSDGGPDTIKGHAAVFNSMSEDLGFYKEVIRAGAFRDAIANSDVFALKNHDENLILGRTSNRTLLLNEDNRGLYMQATPPNTQTGRDTVTEIRDGFLTGQSFSFTIENDTWRTENGTEVREIITVKRLYDVGPVAFPAYTAADINARSILSATGVDFEGLSAAFVRRFRGLELTAADRDVIRRALAVFAEADEVAQARATSETAAPIAQASGLDLRHQYLWLLANS
jgi:HK97 family phage prohead protease